MVTLEYQKNTLLMRVTCNLGSSISVKVLECSKIDFLEIICKTKAEMNLMDLKEMTSMKIHAVTNDNGLPVPIPVEFSK